MPTVPIYVAVYEERPADVSIRRFRGIKRAAHVEQGTHWHQVIFPRRFTIRAAASDQHQPRSGPYKKRKRRLARDRVRLKNGRYVQKGGQADLVFSGEMEESLTRFAAIRGFPTRATVTMEGPRYTTLRPYRRAGPDKVSEMQFLRADELHDLEEILNQSTATGLNELRAPRTTKAT